MLKKKVLISEYYSVPKEPSVSSNDIGQGSQPSMTPQIVGKYKVITLRLTTSTPPLVLLDLFKKFFPLQRWIVSIEKDGTADQHYHIVIDPAEGEQQQQLKQVRSLLKNKLFPALPIKLPPGNGSYCLAWNKNDNIFPYTLKDGKFWYQGYTLEEIEQWSKASYRKYTKNDFGTDLEKIRVKYMTTNMDINDATMEYIQLKIQFKQTINVNNISTFMRGWFYAKHPQKIKDLSAVIVNNILPDY